ncbi:antibiotic biosynthesis monooxygenase family protein [Photorhabdus caribbeanensis]|uniref:antibiotic biosynthesis monooxygenase family protein n=1 Tax=Photorhabdus caribbeanensis TaxID=1004165 RepID=UPI001BD5FBBF|nr:antibiotic biosynthesis monooxygenase family protein [Photorhabdus caribbeanensis]MBS9423670.1 antibiotic biosynthesis monooxygenase [Photorhabdus caribbeanensis]
MVKLEEMDTHVTLREQLFSNTDGSIVLVNIFHVDPSMADALIETWKEDAEYFRSKVGLISAQLHRGIAGSGTFMNYAIWESLERFRDAFMDPEFKEKLSKYPDGIVGSPHVFQKVAVPGICVA